MISIRPLKSSDLSGFLETLGEFRSMDNLSYPKAIQAMRQIRSNPLHRVFVAIEDNKVLGCLTVFVEPKFIHEAGNVLHLEDLVVRQTANGMGIAKQLVSKSIEFAHQNGCYKILSDCSEENRGFWEKCGLYRHEHAMRLDLDPSGSNPFTLKKLLSFKVYCMIG